MSSDLYKIHLENKIIVLQVVDRAQTNILLLVFLPRMDVLVVELASFHLRWFVERAILIDGHEHLRLSACDGFDRIDRTQFAIERRRLSVARRGILLGTRMSHRRFFLRSMSDLSREKIELVGCAWGGCGRFLEVTRQGAFLILVVVRPGCRLVVVTSDAGEFGVAQTRQTEPVENETN